MSRAAPGFTLVEVLVALAIVALGMAAVLGALSSSADTLSYLRDRTLAQWVGLNQIATLRLSANPPATGTSEGDADMAGRSWHWRQEVTATDVPGMSRIEVNVRPAGGAQAAGENSGWVASVTGSWGDAIDHTPNTNPLIATWPGQGPAGAPSPPSISPAPVPVGAPISPNPATAPQGPDEPGTSGPDPEVPPTPAPPEEGQP